MFGRRAAASAGAAPGEARLAERFAAGEITEQEYRERAPSSRSRPDERDRGRDDVVEVRGLTKRYGDARHRGRRHRPDRAPRRDLRLPRPERRRQDHDPADAARSGRAERGHACPCSGATPGDPAAWPGSARWSRGRRSTRTCPGSDNLRVVARYAGVPASRIAAALQAVDLADRGGDKFSTYSLGHEAATRRRRRAAQGPRAGRSSTSRPTGWTRPACATCAGWSATSAPSGRTVLLSSHLLGEVQQICDRVGVIDRGRMIAESTVDELRGGERAGGRRDTLGRRSRAARGDARGRERAHARRACCGSAPTTGTPPTDQPDAGRRRRRGHRAAARRTAARGRVPRDDRPRPPTAIPVARRTSMSDIVRAELFKLGQAAGGLGAARGGRRPQPGLRLPGPLPVLPVR